MDVLVCNAYAVDLAPAHAMPPSSWRHQLEANLTGAFLGFQACVADLQREGYSYSDDAALLAERST